MNQQFQNWLKDVVVILDEPSYAAYWSSDPAADFAVGYDTDTVCITVKYRIVELFGSTAPALELYVGQQDVTGSSSYPPLNPSGDNLTERGTGELVLDFVGGANRLRPNGLPLRLTIVNPTSATKWSVQLNVWVQRRTANS
jgi:hypothetical protein